MKTKELNTVAEVISYLQKFDSYTKVIFNTGSEEMMGDYNIELSNVTFNSELNELFICL